MFLTNWSFSCSSNWVWPCSLKSESSINDARTSSFPSNHCALTYPSGCVILELSERLPFKKGVRTVSIHLSRLILHICIDGAAFFFPPFRWMCVGYPCSFVLFYKICISPSTLGGWRKCGPFL